MRHIFPDNFLWGVATAAYQNEGGAHEDGKGPSIWDTYCAEPGRTYQGGTGEIACDHYHRWEEDVALMKELGLTAYRFSISWPRILATGRGTVNKTGLDFYRRLAGALRDAGIEPATTLYHWDLPQALQDEGGWPAAHIADDFAEYAQVCFDELGDLIKLWITHNEPRHSAYNTYTNSMDRGAPGGCCSPEAGLRANHTILRSHGLAVQRYRDCKHNDGTIGITLDPVPMHPASDKPEDVAAAHRRELLINRIWLDPILGGENPEPFAPWIARCEKPELTADELKLVSTPIDFLGLNYYSVETVAFDRYNMLTQTKVVPPPDGKVVGFLKLQVCPEGMSEIFGTIYRDYGSIPLYITENGFPTEGERPGPDGVVADDDRIEYTRLHLAEAHKTIQNGFDLRGYFHWSLMDNFEWKFGYLPLLGLIRVDRDTLDRTIKKSGRWYAGIIAANGLDS